MARLKRLWSNLRTSFWFLPAIIVAGSILCAVGLIDLDLSDGGQWIQHWPHVFGAGAAGARGMLSTIAGSMMTVVGVTFSMTLVTLALASGQYTSRILRNFMRDRVTQVVLGIFAGVFAYCLIVLRTIRGGENDFVPSFAVSFGVVLAIGGIGMLIFFIHHIASSIQASSIIASVAEETLLAVDRLFPAKLGEGPEAGGDEPADLPEGERIWHDVPARKNGYIQHVDEAKLLRLAGKHNTIVRMEYGIGEFAVRETPLVSVALSEPPGEEVVSDLQDAFLIGRHRTLDQDATFGIRQIVDMALRALSPGTNDTTTAVMCLHHLTAILAWQATRSIPAPHRFEDSVLRVITQGPTFVSLMAEAFDQIRGSASNNLAVLLQLFDGLKTIARQTPSASRRQVVREHGDRLAEAGRRTLSSPHDRARFERRLEEFHATFHVPAGPTQVVTPQLFQ